MHKSTAYIIFLCINANLGAFFFGYQVGVLNMSQTAVNNALDIQESEKYIEGIVNACVPFGALFGSILSQLIVKKTSRKNTLIIADIIGIIGCSFTFFLTLSTFVVYRVIAGFSVGINSVLVPVYVTEFSPVSLKGLTGSLNGLFIPFGILISYLLGYGIDITQTQTSNTYLIFIFIFPTFLIILRTILLLTYFKANTPLHHVEKGEHEQAKKVLGEIYHKEHVHGQYYCVYEQHEDNVKNEVGYKDMLKPHLKKRLTVGCCLQIFQQCSGIAAVIFYSNVIFSKTTGDITAFWLSCLFTLELMLTALVSGAFLKYYGRKQILIVGQIIVVITELGLSIGSYLYDSETEQDVSQYVIIACIYMYTFGYGISLGPIVWLYNAEILPSKGVSLTVLTNWIGCLTVTFLFPIANEAFGMWPVFLFFCISVIIGLIFTYSKVKETKGLSPLEIAEMYGIVSSKSPVKQYLVPKYKKNKKSLDSVKESDQNNSLLSDKNLKSQQDTQETEKQSLHTDSKGYNLLQASYSMPNIINPFLAGILIDKIGMRIGIIGYTTFMVVGITIEYIATLSGSYSLMMVGIICFGIGSEAMCIIISSFAASWFMGKQLSLGLGVMTASANFGSVLANWVLPPLYKEYDNITFPYLICVIVQIGGYISAFLMCGIDYKAEKDDKKRKALQLQESSNSVEKSLLVQDSNQQHDIDLIEKEDNEQKETISWKDLKKLSNLMFWLINGVYCFQCAAMIPFQNNLQNILLHFYGLEEVGAGRILSIITLQTALITPVFAYITDKIGRRAEFLIISSIIQCITFLIWMYLPVCEDGGCYWYYLPIIVNGFGASVMSAVVYPAVPLVVDNKVLGSAFGIQDCAQQLGMFLAPLIAGPIMQYGQKPSVDSYYWFYTFFLGCGIVSFVFSIIIYFYDIKTGKRLNAKEGEYDKKKQSSKIKRSILSVIR